MEGKIFRSNISISFLIIMGVLFCAIVYSTGIKYGSFFNPHSYFFIGIFILIVFAYLSIYYVLTDKEIEIYYLCGLFGKPFGKIYIPAITSVERSYNPLNAPAGALKRLRFQFKRGYKWHNFLPLSKNPFIIVIYPSISPVREQEFLEILKKINPDIQIKINDKKGWWRFWDF